MKRLLILLCLLPLSSFADHLGDFHEVKKSLRHGDGFRFYVDYSRCKPKMSFSAYYEPRAVMVFKHRLVFSSKHLTFNNPNHVGKPILENVHYVLNKNGELTIHALHLYAHTLEKTRHQPPTVTCEMDHGVWFYDD